MGYLDLITLGIALAIVSVMSVLVLFIFWRINMELPGVLHWTLGGLCFALAFLSVFVATLFSFPDNIGPFFANWLSLTGVLFSIEGSLRFRGCNSTVIWRLLLASIPVIGFVLWIAMDMPLARYLFHDGMMVVGMSTVALIMLWRIGDSKQQWVNSLAAFSAIVVATGFFARWQYALNATDLSEGVFIPINGALFLAILVFNIGWTYGLGLACYYRSNQQVMALAREDSLTGLPNRRCLDETLVSALAASERSDQAFALAIVDINGFKAVNDNRGHTIGDELLVGLSERLRQALRGADFAGRLGGDEFLVLAHGLRSDEDEKKFVHRLREKLDGQINLSDGDYLVSVSIGLAVWPVDGLTAHQLLMVADQRMYENKCAIAGFELHGRKLAAQESTANESPGHDSPDRQLA